MTEEISDELRKARRDYAAWHTADRLTSTARAESDKLLSDAHANAEQIVAEGERAALAALADWAARGSARSRVDGCETSWTAAAGSLTTFGVTG